MAEVDIDRDTAHELAQQELNKPIYPKPSLSERLSDWLNEVIYRIVDSGSSVPGGWFTLTVLLILVAAAVVVAVRVARNTMHTNRNGDMALFGTAERSADQHRASAEQYAAAGDFAAAIRHRLRAIARHLEETGVLDAVPGRTSLELARAAGAAMPDLSAEFVDAATVFNDVTFGERPGTPESYRQLAQLDDHLRSRPPTPRGPVADPAAQAGWAQIR
ncbi:membrane protein [Mycolicibacterium chitae]|uniref:Conserved membrane protein of uncharacterized function n=1 Tax=Mycolicibacterium chitae TaxID=1792 RepID=A0A3S5EHW9_MYCCI|nr:DUF4129 domain-containing protein [Mycolicibacterium chitae]MCV7104286.1 DUF4129 domain-containing protein [Mycolicibacterium chitae]BBZ02374.1 membrane protein [Mycolicibacterium chitae]VEG44832.1 Conserved membrane protein of uncharacterised function [Mycolicibacterium chitae]